MPNGGRIDMTFEAWMKEINGHVIRKTGVSVDDLPDCPFRDWYDDGVKPTGAASRAIRNAKDE
jgi:hypothetical protein